MQLNRDKKVKSGYLGDRVVDVDGGDFQLALFQHLVQVVDACGGFLGHTTDT